MPRLYPSLRASSLALRAAFDAFGEVKNDLLFGFGQRGGFRFLANEDFVQRRFKADRHQQNYLKGEVLITFQNFVTAAGFEI